MVYYRSLARSRAARPKRNGTETERKCNGGVQVIERQMAELAFRFNGMERNGNVTVFMPPTVTVKAMLDKDGRANPFRQNMPGKDWWYAFLKRHPEISQRTPEVLQKSRAYSCTPAAIEKWFSDFESFVVLNDIKNQSRRIWNADESGFPLCPNTSRVIAMRNQKHVYSVNSDSKYQITTLVAANASGNVIPPMHIYPGKRAPRSNLLKGCVDGAYYGRSDKGWMTTKLFYGWLANHFAKQIPPERPVLLLMDGHSTHIDVEVSKLCSQNGILL